MKLYSKYILKKLLGPLLLMTLTITAIIWLTQVVNFVKYITEEGVELSLFFYITILLLPSLLLIIIPISLCVSVIMVYYQMIMNNEIAILRSSGISKLTLIKPAIIIAFLSAIVCYMISFYFMPLSSRQHRIIKEYVKNNYSSILISSGEFKDLKHLTMYASEKDSDGNMIGILIFDNGDPLEPMTIVAQAGKIISNNEGIVLNLKNGVLQKTSADIKSKNPAMLYFKEYNINMSSYGEEGSEAALKPVDRYITELLNYKNLGDQKYTKERLRKELHYRLTFPLMTVILTLIGLSSILYGGFNRRGKGKNIRNASIATVSFFAITMYIYEAMETYPIFSWALYGFFTIVICACLYLIVEVKKI